MSKKISAIKAKVASAPVSQGYTKLEDKEEIEKPKDSSNWSKFTKWVKDAFATNANPYTNLEASSPKINTVKKLNKEEAEVESKDSGVDVPDGATPDEMAKLFCGDENPDCIEAQLQQISEVKEESDPTVFHQFEISMGVEMSTNCPFCGHWQQQTKCSPISACSGAFASLAAAIYNRAGTEKKSSQVFAG